MRYTWHLSGFIRTCYANIQLTDIFYQSLETKIEAQATDCKPADEQQDHTDIPERPLVIPEGKIEAVKTAVQPAFHAAVLVDQAEQFAFLRIHINPAFSRIIKPDAQYRQGQLVIAGIVIIVIVRQQCGVSHVGIHAGGQLADQLICRR